MAELPRKRPTLVEASFAARKIMRASCPWRSNEMREAYQLGAFHALRGVPRDPPRQLSRRGRVETAYNAGYEAVLDG